MNLENTNRDTVNESEPLTEQGLGFEVTFEMVEGDHSEAGDDDDVCWEQSDDDAEDAEGPWITI